MNILLRIYTLLRPPTSPKDQDALRFGILGAANIAPPALINPARSHPGVVVQAVAARDVTKAKAYAAKHLIPTFYGGPDGYQKLLDDENIDVVYNPLPNGLHYEWTMKALAAEKHVLLEKPSANTAEETRAMFALAKSKNLVLLEAFHYRFHPAMKRVKEILSSQELGAIKSIQATLEPPAGLIGADDIRYNYSLGGGSLMDTGCYTVNAVRYLASACTVLPAAGSVTSASSRPAPDSRVDGSTIAHLALPDNVSGSIQCSLARPRTYGFIPLYDISITVTLEGGTVEMSNFVLPTLYHSITVTPKDKPQRTEKVYKYSDGTKGDEWWSTYRFQLEAFVDRVKGRQPATWVEEEDSVANMAWIEAIYEKNGLGCRPASTYTAPQ